MEGLEGSAFDSPSGVFEGSSPRAPLPVKEVRTEEPSRERPSDRLKIVVHPRKGLKKSAQNSGLKYKDSYDKIVLEINNSELS